MAEAVLCIDIGSTATKVAVVAEQGELLAVTSAPTPAGPGADFAVDPEALVGVVASATERCLAEASLRGEAVAAVTVTGQRCTTLLYDGEGTLLAALSWQDPRSEPDRAALAEAIHDEAFVARTGLPHSTMWTLTKLCWLRRTRPERAARVARVALLHDDLLDRLGGERLLDPSNASPTGLWALESGAWDDDLLSRAGLARGQLPAVVPAGTRAGELSAAAAARLGLVAGTPLLVGGGDQPCATLGMAVVEPGCAGLCLGTAADITRLVGSLPTLRPGRICTPHVVPGAYLLEGFLSGFGVALDWARGLGPEAPPEDGAADAAGEGPFFLPFLTGVGTPDFQPAQRGALVGLTPEHGPRAIAWAVREGLAWELRRILESGAVGSGVRDLGVSGGASTDASLVQALADGTGRTLHRHPSAEVSLLGLASLAWRGLGRYRDAAEAARAFSRERLERVAPRAGSRLTEARYTRYLRWMQSLSPVDSPSMAEGSEARR